jgi:hypothetical protein
MMFLPKKQNKMPAKISIFLTRRAGADDEISITPVMDDFKILYFDGIAKSTHFVYASESEVIAYVDDLYNLLVDDVIDPFKSIQFTFPCFPSVLYKVPDFSNQANRAAIRDRLISTLRNWPEAVRSLGLFNPPQSSNVINHNTVPISPLFNAINPNATNAVNYLFPIAIDRTENRADSPSEDIMRFPDLDFII